MQETSAVIYRQVARSVGGRSRWRAAAGSGGGVVALTTRGYRDPSPAARRRPAPESEPPASATDTVAPSRHRLTNFRTRDSFN